MGLRLAGRSEEQAHPALPAALRSYKRDATREVAMGGCKEEVDARLPESEILEAWIPSEPEKPYRAAIRTAFIQKFATWYMTSPETNQLEKEWTLLACLLFHRPPGLSKHDWRKLDTQPPIIRVLRHALRVTADHTPRGRPIGHKRRVAALALDLQISDPERWTWRSLTNHLCNCGLREHGPLSKCQKDLRRQTVWLKKWLRTQEIEVPVRKNP
jgi:hypothetical protein